MIRLKTVLLSVCLCLPLTTYTQVYNDYFGGGHNIGVTVSSSDAQGGNDVGSNTLSGTDLIPDLIGASRFLSQASLGATYEDIEYVAQIGIESWIDEQINLAASSYLNTYKNIYNTALTDIYAVYGAATDSTRKMEYLSYSFYHKTFADSDVLRQKLAFALSQIFVVSGLNSDIDDRGYGLSSYYDLLYEGAFGNFRDMLGNVSLHPVMGVYLSHFQNRKADPVAETLPDENFAREIMQLFTIGLYELNNDGSHKLDADGNSIPTYDIVDIQELAKVFTGLSGGDWDLELRPDNAGDPLVFWKGYKHYDFTVPMAMYEDFHETESKTMIDDSVIPAGQPGMQDVNDALDVLFNHPNVGPFISIRLIQQLVKSNPSPAYINRVASVFNNNGQGVRGDMEAVIKAILLDPEARDCEWIDNIQAGKLLQPIERLTNLCIAFDVQTPSGRIWFRDYSELLGTVEQSFLMSPTVFNFFTPFYAESEYVAPNNMVSPEFQILHSTSGIHYINMIEDGIKDRPFKNRTMVNPNNENLTTNSDDEPFLDFSDEILIYDTNGLEALIDHLDLIICRGQLSADVRSIIINSINEFETSVGGNLPSQDVVQDVLYFMMMSPSYVILK